MLVSEAAVAVYACLNVAWAVHREMILMAVSVDRVGSHFHTSGISPRGTAVSSASVMESVCGRLHSEIGVFRLGV